SIKRVAMQVEDHPVAYGSFEGIIPPGEYGGGTVMLWDQGTWEPVGDADEGFRTGRLKFTLHGKKLRGRWMLVQTGARGATDNDRRRWLLFKERDQAATPESEGNVLDELPMSASTGRSLEEIATDRDWTWNGKADANRQVKARVRAGAAPPPRFSDYDAHKKQFAGVRLTNPEKLLYPEQGITKLELAQYYQLVAKWMLPHVIDRPLVLVRCPDGRDKGCFYQKHPGAGTPDAFRQIPISDKSKTENYLIADDVQGLISLAQIGALEIHCWGSRSDKLEKPDRLIFDLDPAPDFGWAGVVQSARQI